MKKIALLFIFFIFHVGLSVAQTLFLTYEEAVNIALNKSYTIKSFNISREITKYWYNYNKANFKPRLDINLTLPSWNESIQTIYQVDGLPVYNSLGSLQVGGMFSFTYVLPTGGELALSANSYYDYQNTASATHDYNKMHSNLYYNSFSLSFTQPIFTKNKLRENLKEAELEFLKATAQYTRAQMDIIHEVTKGFYALYRAARLVQITKEKLNNSQEALRISKLKSDSGLLPEGTVLTIEVEVAQDEAELSAATGDFEREKDIFKLLIGLDLDTDIELVVSLKDDFVIVDLGLAIREALANRLELEEAEYDVKLQQIKVDRANRTRRIQANVSGFYNLTGISTIGSGSFSELFQSSIRNIGDRPNNRGIMLNLSYPIADWGRGKSLVKQAEVELSGRTLALENYQNTIIQEVKDIVRTVSETQNRLIIHKRNQELAQRSYRIFTLRFQNGDISEQELAIERERLSSVQLSYLDAYIENKLAISSLKRITMWDFQNNKSYKVK